MHLKGRTASEKMCNKKVNVQKRKGSIRGHASSQARIKPHPRKKSRLNPSKGRHHMSDSKQDGPPNNRLYSGTSAGIVKNF
eukprot:4468234-Pleurochrysis_carterae.AAC.1